MQRIIEDVINGAFLDDAPCVHNNDFIGKIGDDTKIVGDEHNCHPHFRLEFLHETKHLRLDRHIEGSRGFIGNEQCRRTTECHGNHDPLTHTTGKLVRILINALGRGRYTDARYHFNCAFARRLLINLLV